MLAGANAGIDRPMGVAIDPVNDEIWVSNFIGHTALVFDRKANGNAAPKRIVRTAPPRHAKPRLRKSSGCCFDSKREQIWFRLSSPQPRIAAFAREANGTMAPTRVITGTATKMSRTVHGIAYDTLREEMSVPNALADAVLVFRGGMPAPSLPFE